MLFSGHEPLEQCYQIVQIRASLSCVEYCKLLYVEDGITYYKVCTKSGLFFKFI